MMSCQTSGMRTLTAIAFTNFALRNGALCGLFLTQTTDRFRFSVQSFVFEGVIFAKRTTNKRKNKRRWIIREPCRTGTE